MAPRHASGFTLLDLLFVVAIVSTLGAMAVPQSLRTLDDFRARSAARYVAQRVAAARFDAVRRSTAHGLRFEAEADDYRVAPVADGNGNGLRTAEIQRGIDRTLAEPERLSAHFSGVAFGIGENVPDVDGAAAGSTDGVRLGAAKLLTMNGDGTATPGTLYIRGGSGSQYAVRVLGSTGRVRILKFDRAQRRWGDLP